MKKIAILLFFFAFAFNASAQVFSGMSEVDKSKKKEYILSSIRKKNTPEQAGKLI